MKGTLRATGLLVALGGAVSSVSGPLVDGDYSMVSSGSIRKYPELMNCDSSDRFQLFVAGPDGA